MPATPWGGDVKEFGHQTPRDNVAPLAALEVKVDTYVLETDVHFPTDLNLLWDAGRKCVDLIQKYRDQFGCQLPGWRKAKQWRRQLKNCERITSHIVYRGGPNKEARVKRAVRDYLRVGQALGAKVHESLLGLCDQTVEVAHWEALEYFHRMLAKHLDLVQRRLLNEETIPAHEKVFSLFEAHTEWIQKARNARTWNWVTSSCWRPARNYVAQAFLRPVNSTHRQYEALRAFFVHKLPTKVAAQRFGYSPGSFRVLAHQFRHKPSRPFFLTPARGPQHAPQSDPWREQIIQARKQNLRQTTNDLSRLYRCTCHRGYH